MIEHRWPEENDRIEQIEWMASEADTVYDSAYLTFAEARVRGWDAERYAVELIDNYIDSSESVPDWFDKIDYKWMIERVMAACEAA